MSKSGIVYFHDLENDYYTVEHPLTQRYLKVIGIRQQLLGFLSNFSFEDLLRCSSQQKKRNTGLYITLQMVKCQF